MSRGVENYFEILTSTLKSCSICGTDDCPPVKYIYGFMEGYQVFMCILVKFHIWKAKIWSL